MFLTSKRWSRPRLLHFFLQEVDNRFIKPHVREVAVTYSDSNEIIFPFLYSRQFSDLVHSNPLCHLLALLNNSVHNKSSEYNTAFVWWLSVVKPNDSGQWVLLGIFRVTSFEKNNCPSEKYNKYFHLVRDFAKHYKNCIDNWVLLPFSTLFGGSNSSEYLPKTINQQKKLQIRNDRRIKQSG